MTILAPTPIAALPAVPSLSDISTFSSRTDTFINALPTFRTETNLLATNVYNNALELSAAVSGAVATAVADATAAASAASGSASAASGSASAASGSASAADASAIAAASAAAGITSTSTTSITIGIGAQTFTTQSGKQYTTGIWINITSIGTPTNWMFGQVTSYTSTTLIVNVTSIGGSGTATDWNISISGLQGVQGIPGTGVTAQAVGFVATGGTTPKTLTVNSDLTTSTVVTLNGTESLDNKRQIGRASCRERV